MHKISTILKECYNYDNWQNKCFLECGAGPQGDETADFQTTNDCYYLEPIEEYFNMLLLTKNKNKVFKMGLSDISGEVNFTETSHCGNASISHSQEHIAELKSYNSSFNLVKIKTTTYEDFLNLINKNIDILVLDIEGHEINVLNTFLNLEKNKKPKIIVIECGYDWKDRLNILKKLNYNLDFYYFNNAYLTLNSFNIDKNIQNILKYKKEWKSWSWAGKVIYSDEDL